MKTSLFFASFFVLCNFYGTFSASIFEPKPTKNCTKGYFYFKATNSCYGRGPEIGVSWMTWPKAEQYCEKQGGHLPSLHSMAETKFVISLNAKQCCGSWVGLYSIDELYSWKWSDASATDFIPWYSGGPWFGTTSNTTTCAWADSEWNPKRGTLVNTQCGIENYFICQLPLN